MMIRKKYSISIIFITIFFILFLHIQNIFLPNWQYIPNSSEGETDRYMSFYEHEPDTLDYLVLGVSHSFYSINPTQIYSESGLKGYNLGSPSQPMSVSYYWLAEACKYQNPSYVFLDVGSLLYTQDAYNANQITKALLYMLPSLNKLQAILNCRAEGQSVSELLVPLIQFHTRWNELNQSDWEKGTNLYYLNGAYINFNSVLDTGKSELNPNGTIQYRKR